MAKKDKKTMDLPEVKDIPGQENVKPPRLGELADSTASSADEEGDDILEQDDDLVGPGTNVSPEERRALARAGSSREIDTEDDVLDEAALDSTDDDGDPLNEGSFGRDVTGDDLDIPDEDEDDEENSDYSTDKNEDDSEINYDA